MTTTNPEPAEAGTPVPFPLVLGLDTFGDLIYDQAGRPLTHAETIRSLVEQGVLPDRVGIDFFGIGEHPPNHFPMPEEGHSHPGGEHRSGEHTAELPSPEHPANRLLLEKKK